MDLFELVKYNIERYNEQDLSENTLEMSQLVSSCLDVFKKKDSNWGEPEPGDINDVAFAKSTLKQWLNRQAGTWEKYWPVDTPPTDIDAVWAFTQLVLSEKAYHEIFELIKDFFGEFKWNIETP